MTYRSDYASPYSAASFAHEHAAVLPDGGTAVRSGWTWLLENGDTLTDAEMAESGARPVPDAVMLPADSWAVTALAHRALNGQDPCPGCLALTRAAVADARATGSTSATYTEDARTVGAHGAHACTVSRAYALHEPWPLE